MPWPYDRAVRVAGLIVLYALIAIVGVFVFGTSVPPCFGRVPDGKISDVCLNQWLASRSPIDSFFANPWAVAAFVLVATALTIWWSRRRRPSE